MYIYSLCCSSRRYTSVSSSTNIRWSPRLIQLEDEKIDRHRPVGAEGQKTEIEIIARIILPSGQKRVIWASDGAVDVPIHHGKDGLQMSSILRSDVRLGGTRD